MADKTIGARQKQKYDTSANWATNNPVLLAGEIGIESDTNKMKVGDGTNRWTELGYIGRNVTVSFPIGSIIMGAIPLNDASVHLLDGEAIAQDGIYAEFCTYLKNLVTSNSNITCSQTEFDADVSHTGNCGKFVIDDTAGTIRLPKITRFIQGLDNIANIGTSLEAGLPNIEGQFQARSVNGNNNLATYPDLNQSGAFSYKGNVGATWYGMANGGDNSSNTPNSVIKLDASKSSKVYSGSDTVQPQATQYPYYVVLANSVKTDVQVNIDNVVSELNLKAGKDDINGIFKSREVVWLPDMNVEFKSSNNGNYPYTDATLNRPSDFAGWGIVLMFFNESFTYGCQIAVGNYVVNNHRMAVRTWDIAISSWTEWFYL